MVKRTSHKGLIVGSSPATRTSMRPGEFTHARLKLGLSRDEMAKELGLKSTRAIYYYESGARAISGPIEALVKVLLERA